MATTAWPTPISVVSGTGKHASGVTSVAGVSAPAATRALALAFEAQGLKLTAPTPDTNGSSNASISTVIATALSPPASLVWWPELPEDTATLRAQAPALASAAAAAANAFRACLLGSTMPSFSDASTVDAYNNYKGTA